MNKEEKDKSKNIIEYETFLDKYNYSKFRKKLDTINYKRMNIPPKQIYKKNKK